MKLVVALLLVPAVARAAPDGGALPFVAHDGGSFVDVHAALAADALEDGSRTGQGVDVAAQQMIGGGLGVYGAFGVARGTATYAPDITGPDVHVSAVSPLDLEVGGLYRVRGTDSGGALTLTLGVSLPTVTNDPNGVGAADAFLAPGDPVDEIRAVNRAALRAGATASLRSDNGLVAAAHVGVDLVPTDGTALIDFAGVIGGETDGGVSVVAAVGGNRPAGIAYPDTSLVLALEGAYRTGTAQLYLGVRGGHDSEGVIGGEVLAGLRRGF